ncbi:hypothetical protein C8R44DRAFT_793625 [Mycena epipterygia]|nr:hypothetical protein C8R44DRAFT_793625 [Mycena epipterygia]
MFSVDARWSTVDLSSSPPSSPTAYNDSSPASSPGRDLDDSLSFANDSASFGEAPPHASPPLHPFAASAKGSWIPPEYEKGGKKNRRMSPSSPSRSRVKKPRLVGPEASLETVVASSPRVFATSIEADKESMVWDAATARVIDNGNGTINLEHFNLSSIPKKAVKELADFFVPEEKVERLNAGKIAPLAPPPLPPARQFGRSITAPAILGSGERAVGVARHDIQLYLAGNQITRLPAQLFHLDKLTFLSLRQNMLKTLPPEIRHLRNLKHLNVAGNQLQYLPAEILSMTLDTLSVFPNSHFRKDPDEQSSATRQFHRAESAQGRVAVSPTLLLSQCRVPSLVELGFRSLFSAEPGLPPTANHAERRIAHYYDLPLYEDGVDLQFIPPNLRRVFDAIHPGSVDPDLDTSSESDDDPPSLGLCPSPQHDRESVFVTPAEERYTWETVVAGVSVGGKVPLKWRGCLRGCLDFLSLGMEEHADATAPMEVDQLDAEQDAVTQLQFARSEGFGMTDFEDDG